MKRFVRITALVLAALFLSGAGLAAFDVLTHENMLRNPELKFAGGWLLSGLMLLTLALRGRGKVSDKKFAAGQSR
jgi:hypothetical protein